MSRNVNSHNPFSLLFSIFQKNPGFGKSDGTFRNKRYFTCAPDSGVFVGLDKLAPFEDDNSELRTPSDSAKRDDHGEVNIKSRQGKLKLTLNEDKEIPTRSLGYNVQRKASGNIVAVLLFMCSSMVLHSIHVLYNEFIGLTFCVLKVVKDCEALSRIALHYSIF